MPPTSRTGSSTATTRCRRQFRKLSGAKSWSKTRLPPTIGSTHRSPDERSEIREQPSRISLRSCGLRPRLQEDAMNIEVRQSAREGAQRVKPAVIDCDIHPKAPLEEL